MEPYWTDGKRTIYHGDCREILPTLGRFDLLLTDPPYGIGACNRSDGGVGSIASGSKKYGRVSWDLEKPSVELIASAIKCCSSAVVWGGNYFTLPLSSCWLVWDKEQRNFTFADAELAWTNFEKAVRCFSYSRGALVTEGKVHPTQKPIPLMRWCISFAPNAKTILDPFMGSGTTLLAAKLEGLEAVGIELSEKYCEAAVKRLQQNTLEFVDG